MEGQVQFPSSNSGPVEDEVFDGQRLRLRESSWTSVDLAACRRAGSLASPVVPPVPVWINSWATSTVTASSLSPHSVIVSAVLISIRVDAWADVEGEGVEDVRVEVALLHQLVQDVGY